MARYIGNLQANWANASIDYTGIGMNMNVIAYGSESALLDLKLNSNSLIRLTANGVLYVNGFPIGTNANTNVGPAFDKANNANVIAVLAYDAANAAGGPTVGLAFNKANAANILAFSAFQSGNSTYTYAANDVMRVANTAYARSNSIHTYAANDVMLVANSAFQSGNSTYTYAANDVMRVANTAYARANSNHTYAANDVMLAANSAFGVSTGANAYMLVTVAGANIAVGSGANSVGSAAFAKANAALANTSGIIFGGELNISGNLAVGGVPSTDKIFVYSPSTYHYSRISNFTANTMLNVGAVDYLAWANNGTHYTQMGMFSGSYGFLIFHANTYGLIATSTMTPLYLATTGITRLSITANGWVGIATTAPTANLHVFGNTTLQGYVSVSTGNVAIGASNSDSKLLVTNNSSPPQAPHVAGTLLHVAGADGMTTRIMLDAYGANPNFTFRTAAGTVATPSAVTAGQAIGAITVFGYGATGYSATSRAGIVPYAAETWTDTAQGALWTFNTTSIGSIVQAERMRISDNGWVGIATTAPTANLHVVGNTTITSSLTVATINVVPAIAAAYDTANAAGGTVGSEAFNKANSANILAESAYTQANNALAAAVALAIALG